MNLNDLIETTRQSYQQHIDTEVAAKQTQRQQAEREAVEAFKTALTAELGTDLIETLNVWPEIATTRGSANRIVVEGHFTFEEVAWTLTQEPTLNRTVNWRLTAKQPTARATLIDHVAVPGEVRDRLLVGLGDVREALRQQAEAAEAAARRREQERVEQEQRQQTLAEERQARADQYAAEQAELARVDAEIQALIEQRQAETLAALWRWPDGMTIVYYTLIWQTGAGYVAEEAGVAFDYDRGWAEADALDERGYITVYPTSIYGKPRTVKLDPEIHKPYWDRHEARQADDLPPNLREMVRVQVPGITDTWDADGRHYYAYGEGESVEVDVVAGQPVAWVQALVDRAALVG